LMAMATRARERARPQALDMIVGACLDAAGVEAAA